MRSGAHPSGHAALVAYVVAAAGALAACVAACGRHEPPGADPSASSAAPELPVGTSSGALADASPQPMTTDAGADAGVDPATLPQTRDRPVASGAAFEQRVAGLWSAIVADDPTQAMPFFFPLPAYQQVKDVSDPASDWKHRLVAAFAHDIHALHRRLGADATTAKLDGLDVPESRGRWVDPGEEYNKLGYYRVFGSKLRYEVDGASRSFEVKSLISWRGEWYVVHLSAIQ